MKISLNYKIQTKNDNLISNQPKTYIKKILYNSKSYSKKNCYRFNRIIASRRKENKDSINDSAIFSTNTKNVNCRLFELFKLVLFCGIDEEVR